MNILGQAGRLAAADEEEGPDEPVAPVADVLVGGRGAVEVERPDLVVDQAEGDEADRSGVVGDDLPDRAVRILGDGAPEDPGLAHDQLLEGAPRARALLAGDDGDGLVGAAEELPVP